MHAARSSRELRIVAKESIMNRFEDRACARDSRMFAALLGLSRRRPSAGLGMLRAELTGPTAEDRQITLAVTRYMRDGHITRHELNDEIAERMMTNFLKTLDAQKVFFYQATSTSSASTTNELDDLIRRGNVDFAFQVFNVYLKRLDERVKWVDKLLAHAVRLHGRRRDHPRSRRGQVRQERRRKPRPLAARRSSTTCWS